MARGGPRLDHGRRQELGQSFQDGGEHYQRVRPGYPEESAQWLVPPRARDALDVGAGTGKFTALLLDRGLSVTAVDPSADMLDQLAAHYPAAAAVLGTAEATGLPGSAFDVVSVAQAWHWCDALAASTELARVLRPQGCWGSSGTNWIRPCRGFTGCPASCTPGTCTGRTSGRWWALNSARWRAT